MQNIVSSQREGPVLVIRLNDPASRNSLTMELRDQLKAAIEVAAHDTAVRSVFLTGQGPTFCSGGNLKVLQASCDPWSVHRRFRGLNEWLVPLITLDKPVVVGVNGAAVGGGLGVALAGDVIIAAESATFIAGFFKLGAIPDIATMYHLPRLIGMAQTRQFLFGEEGLSAQRAAQLGFVSKVVADSELYHAGLQEARRLAAGPAQVMGLAKSIMARSFETSLADMLAFEGLGQALAMSNPEFQEGLSAALARRPADFLASATATNTD